MGRGSSKAGNGAGNDSVEKANKLCDYLANLDHYARSRDEQVSEAKKYLPKLYKAFTDTTQEHDALLSDYFRSSNEQKARYKQLSNTRQNLANYILKLEDKVADWDSYKEGEKFREKRRKAGIPDRDLY